MTATINFNENADSDDDMYDSTQCIKSTKYISESAAREWFDFKDCYALKMMHINCRSLKRNFNNLQTLLNVLRDKLTVIAVTETWLSASLTDTIHLPGYNFVSNARTDKMGGGVGFL